MVMGKIGYIRVSTEHQETARQEALMKQYQVERIFAEKISGKNADRPELKAMLEYVREGDTLYIESISRLGRSTRDLLNIIDVSGRRLLLSAARRTLIPTPHRGDSSCRYLRRSQSLNVSRPYSVSVKVLLLQKHRESIKVGSQLKLTGTSSVSCMSSGSLALLPQYGFKKKWGFAPTHFTGGSENMRTD